MECSGREPFDCEKELGKFVADFEPGGADPKLSGHFFKMGTNAVLLFGEETWVLTSRMERYLNIS